MRIPTNTLPSLGKYAKSKFIELPYLKYKDIVIHDKRLTTDPVDTYINEIETVVSKIDDWRSLLLFDLDALIFTMKYISVSKHPEIELITSCTGCGEFKFLLKISDLEFTKIDVLEKIKSINLNGCDYPIQLTVTIGEFYDLLLKIKQWNLHPDIKDVILMAFLIQGENINKVYDAVTNATHEDIAVIDFIKSMLLSSAEVKTLCPKCKKEVVVRLSDLITGIFRILHLNSDISKKITYIK